MAPPVAAMSWIVSDAAFTVPLVCDSVACTPADVDRKVFGVELFATNVTTDDVAPAASAAMPDAKVNVLLAESASAKDTVPAEVTLIGLVNVRPADVIVCVFRPATAKTAVPDKVMSELNVKFW